MKAAQINEYGDASVVKVTDTDRPTISDGKVLVKIYAASLNPFDSTLRSGYFKQTIPLQLPVTLGGDIAGEVIEVAGGIGHVAVGDRVYGQASAVSGNSGALAEFAVTSADQVAKAPSNLNYQEAASLPLVGVSALQGLTKHINLQPGQKIFINGGAGGIGRIAIQIAKHIGAYVAATATGEGIDTISSLGADEAIDYKVQNFTESLQNYDAVFNTVGGDTINDLLSVLKKGGIAVTMAGTFDETLANDAKVTAMRQNTRVTSEALSKLTELVENGAVKPGIGQVFALDDIQAAFTARDNGTVSGKIVIAIR